jgi:trk system potassium uptake protein TrkH
LIYWILERHNTLLSFALPQGFVNALFNGIALRGTGFTTIPVDQLQLATLLLIMVMAFIGSSPGSTGSGIKVTTFTILINTIKSAIKGHTLVRIMGRSIALDQIFKSIAIILLGCMWILFTTFCLLITEEGASFLDILFESVSAFATLGLSTGITPYLSSIGKFFIIMSMIIGRIGALGIVLVFLRKHENPEYSYPEERIILG